MSFLETVRAKRQILANVLADEDYSGIREIVEELYPDRAHFLYELLQNAEDVGATEAAFSLTQRSLVFEHNGEPFADKDVWGITNIGKGTKKTDEESIGRFGVGFKAVFAYTETPRIWSPTFSFEISNLVLPAPIAPAPDLRGRTRFEFPFNNPKKSAADAYKEVLSGLEGLAGTTLLFLSHLASVKWAVGKGQGEIRRIAHTSNHVEVSKRAGNEAPTSSHFLRFSQPVPELESQVVAIAFELEELPTKKASDGPAGIASRFKIVPAQPGRVAVFFPAEKETSGLRFHLQAPFVPELSRASVKDTPANDPLFAQLAELTARSLHEVCRLDLLTVDFLGVLPNTMDPVPPRYAGIRAAVVAEMNTAALTPTHDKSHSPARSLVQGPASLKELLEPNDLEALLGEGQLGPKKWAQSATQRNSNADRFLFGLDIQQWDVEAFVDLVREKSTSKMRWLDDEERIATAPDPAFMTWMTRQPLEWHQRLYAFLYHEFHKNEEWSQFDGLKIVRKVDGTYCAATECFFPTEGNDHGDEFPLIAEGLYTAGKNKARQAAARKFLEAIGVREVGEVEHVRAILDQRYREPFDPDPSDLERFVALVERDPTKATLFATYHILEAADGSWYKPGELYVDLPLMETGLTAFYAAWGEDAERKALAPSYAESAVGGERIGRFAAMVGVQTGLEISAVSCRGNPQWAYLSGAGGSRFTSPIDRDFVIKGLDVALQKPTVSLAHLIWRTLATLPRYPNRLEATYQKTERFGPRKADSQLVNQLRAAEWLPQSDGTFVSPFEASKEMLPSSFRADVEYPWMAALKFGEGRKERAGESERLSLAARELGFADSQTLERAKVFAALEPAEQDRILAEIRSRARAEFPEHESRNVERRGQRIEAAAYAAPEKLTETRMRSVPVGLSSVKAEATAFLRHQYSNAEGDLFCQICKAPMPFRLADGNYYFERVQFLDGLSGLYHQNYLALCPTHAAMFQHANDSADALSRKFAELDSDELQLVLAQQDMSVRFTKTHVADLKQVLRVDAQRALTSD